jgi:hypothetical protein
MQLVPLNIQLDEINTFSGSEVILQFHRADRSSLADTFARGISAMINIQSVGNVKHPFARGIAYCDLIKPNIWQVR